MKFLINQTIPEVKKKKKKTSKWSDVHTKSIKDVKPLLDTIITLDAYSLYWLSQEIASERKKCIERDTTVKNSLVYYTRWIRTMRDGGGWSRDVSRVGSRQVSRQTSPEQEEEEEELDFAEYELTQEDIEMGEADE